MRPSLSSGLAAACLLLAANLPAPAFAKDRIEFNRDVRPILSENCYACHGPDKSQRKAKLRLDEREAATQHGAILPGNPDDSELVLRILSEDDDVMPPAEAHKTLSAEQKQTLQDWIAQGAEYQAHWAYVPPVRHATPEVRRGDWVRNPIDAFLLATLESRNVEPSPEAPRNRLIRRVSLDLIGLPPTPDEVRAFEEDPDPKAYERLVERLLDSPHYGERMAVAWLDLARFADTVGYHGDQGQRVFPYRDYVVDSFNRNKPFDAFTTEQLAGDLLPDPTPEQLVATGFNRLNMMTREGGAQPEEYLAKYAADRVRTVGQTFLGSTFGCAECHDHKYDPITQRDFYTMSAFFADVKQWGVYNDYDYTPNPELKGWSNDHPFPPEIEVQSPYLKARRAQLVERLREVAGRPADVKDLDAWLDATRAFVTSSESGWLAMKPTGDQGSILADESLLVKTAAQADTKTRNSTAAMHFVTGGEPRWVARIRVEMLPPEQGGRIVRDGAEVASVALTATLNAGEGKPGPALKFHFADADFKSPRYFNGDEVPGVLAGWRTSKEHVESPQTAVWSLDPPIQLKEGESLGVAIKSPEAVRLRVSVSPFGLPEDGDPLGGLDGDDRAAILSAEPDRTPEQSARVRRLFHLGTAADAEVWSRSKSLATEIQACRDGRATSLVTRSAPPMETRVLPRGDWQNRTGEVVEPEVPGFLPHDSVATGRRLTRLDLGRWITAPENPLTARVFVNRLWKQIFGVGLSSVMEDVGGQGEWPVHPELLDWLAVEFRESGWDVKRMVRLMVTSSAYRQDSRSRPELKDLDPGNRWVAFLSPRRLEAEFVRDNLLAVAGLLNPDVGGPSAFPYQPAGYYANIQFPNRDYIASEGDLQYRRGLYSHWQRTFLHPMLANFDAPAREECTASRNSANTPQQALTLLNDPTFVEGARVLAAKLLAETGSTSDEDRLDGLFKIVLARPILPAERVSLLTFLAERRRAFREDPAAAEALLNVGQAPAPEDADPAEVAAWAATCRVVLNLHETITRY
ncbi:PSD1 and planctomycete cytochrome C domain-containing protein [Paludisphaera soli]|uniref:PSD1 and planctomycete cytochrome C domain-containing protein n=1 Tax=Paludisphaera soli TaxID=2712865 RepID=UPI0013E9E874|nr:PSD1 and planctomycete cytochrome C domain-containing protein [Paludisphaera soli]